MTDDDESYKNDGGHPSWGHPGKPHANPGCDVTVDPRQPIDDSFRSRKMGAEKEYGYIKLNPSGGMIFNSLRVNPIELREWETEIGRKVIRVVIKESEQRAGERK